ncbi:MAG: universal stress protein [Pseudomonadales bacterium]
MQLTDRHDILVVLDKPKHDQVALERALALAAESGSRLVLTSFCWLPMVTRSDVFDTHQRLAIKKSAMAERRRWLRALVQDRGLAAANLVTDVVWTNDIAGSVAERSAAGDISLVVKSVHRSRTLLHTPLDWELLRTCPVPLLLTVSNPGRRSGNVLATLDLHSRDARHQRLNGRVLAAAARFAELEGARLHCLNVVELDAGFEDLGYFDTQKARRQAVADARSRVVELIGDYPVAKSRIHLPSGKVGQAVASVAGEIKADLVVVGTGARRALQQRLLGNSAEKILQRAGCDVLAVHV